MEDQQPPTPADNSTLLSRLEQLRQYVANAVSPREVRDPVVHVIDEAMEALQSLEPAAMQLVTGGRAMDAFDDFKDIVEQQISVYRRFERWPVAWIGRNRR